MYPEFAYSGEMQLILAVVAFLTTFAFVYVIANLVLLACGEKASKRQKCITALLIGTLLHNVWVYGIFLLGGMVSFTKIFYAFVTTPNPIFALLYYVIGLKVLKFSPIRSIKVMGYFYIYYITYLCLQRVVKAIFFVQPPGPYNYLLDAFTQVSYIVLMLIVSYPIFRILKHNKYVIKITDSLFVNPKKELCYLFIKSSIVYGIAISLPLLITEQLVANILVFVMVLLFFVLNVMADINKHIRLDIENRNAYISLLSKGIDEFSGIKHDFYNILQTYGGYLQLGNLEDLKEYHASLLQLTTHAGSTVELNQRMSENPALIALLSNKKDYAEKMNVKMRITLQSSLENLYMDNIDVCRMIACLLDNAIEEAAISEQKKVSFSIDAKGNISKLIVISNSTSNPVNINTITTHGTTSKQGHQGIGLSTVRKTIAKYGNSTFQLTYYNDELSAYIKIMNDI